MALRAIGHFVLLWSNFARRAAGLFVVLDLRWAAGAALPGDWCKSRHARSRDCPREILKWISISLTADALIKSLRLWRGAPRSMKMGNIVSPWHYDAGASRPIQSPVLRQHAN